MLEEGDECCRHRDDLLGRDVHEIRGGRRGLVVLVAAVHLDALVDEIALRVEPRVGLHDRGELLLVGRQVDDLVAHVRLALAIARDTAIRGLDEAIRVHATVRRQ